MARTRKSIQPLNLYKYEVLIEDKGVRSDYFKISQFDGYFHGGRNAFLVAGAGSLKPNSKILVEILNKDGTTIYSAPIAQFIEGNSRLVQVEVYDNTPIGPGKIVLLGCAQTYLDGTPIPAEWQDKYNVRWVTDVIISPFVENKTPIRFVKSPSAVVTEKFYFAPSSSLFTEKVVLPVDVELSPKYFNIYPNGYLLKLKGPAQETYNTAYLNGTLTGSIAFNNGSYPETASINLPITKIYNSKLAESEGSLIFTDKSNLLLGGLISASGIYTASLEPLGSVIASSSIAIQYSKLDTLDTGSSISFAKIRLVDIKTISGEINKIRLSYKPATEPGEYVLLGDIETGVQELLSIDSGSRIAQTGKFADIAIADYWYSETMSLQKNETAPTLPEYYFSSSMAPSTATLIQNSDDLLNAVEVQVPIANNQFLNGSSYFIGTTDVNTVQLFPDSEYTLTFNALVTRTSSSITLDQSDYSLEVYLIKDPNSSGGKLLEKDVRGQLLGTLTPTSNFKVQNFGSVELNFFPKIIEQGTFGLRFVAYGGFWNVADVSVKTAQEPFFSPDEIDILVPNINYADKILSFKVQYLDVNNNSIGLSTYSTPTYFTGSSVPSNYVIISGSGGGGGGVSFPYIGNAQITGSLSVLGTISGSIASASYALTSSYAKNATLPTGIVSSSTQINTGSFTGSFSGSFFGTSSWSTKTVSSSFATTASYVEFTNVANKPTLISSSIQINTGSFSGSITTSSFAITSSYVWPSGLPAGVMSSSQQTVANISNQNVTLGNVTSSNLLVQGNLFVFGTSSIQYVTSSQILIGSNKIILNDDDLVRFAGMSIYDSGSSSPSTASIYWDSLEHRFIYENLSGSAYNSAILIAGPQHTGSLGNETGLTSGKIPVASGEDHISDSQISDDGALVTITNNLYVSGSVTSSFNGTLQGTSSWANNTVSASAATSITFVPSSASYATTSSYVANLPTGIVSSSTQVNTGSFTGSFIGDASNLVNLPYTSNTIIDTYTFVGNGSTLNYIVSKSYYYTSLFVSVDGLNQTYDIDYGLSGNTVQFINTPPSESNILIRGLVNVVSGSTGSYSGSFIGIASTASYVNYSNIANVPALVSSSTQINTGSFTGSFTGVFTGQVSGAAATASYVEFANVANKPTLVSSSAQINTGSLFGTASWANNAISASFATTASYVRTFPYTGSAIISGSLVVSGAVLLTGSAVGINIAEPENYLLGTGKQLVFGNTTGNAHVTIVTPNTSTGYIFFSDGFGTGLEKSAGGFHYAHNTNLMAFYASSDVRLYLDANALYPNGTINLGTSAAKFNNVYANNFIGTSSLASSASFAISASAANSITFQVNSGSFTGSFIGTHSGSTFGTASNAVSASYSVTASYTPLPIGIVSSSAQINTGSFTGSFTGSLLGTSSWANNVDYNNVTNKPTLVSASNQVSYTGISNIPVGILSSSTQFNALSNTSASFATTSSAATSITFTPPTASYSITASYAANVPGGIVSSSSQINTGSFTGSFIGTHSGSTFGTASWASNAITSSFATTASYVYPTGLPTGTVSSSTQVIAHINNQIITPTTITASAVQTSTLLGNLLTQTSNSLSTGEFIYDTGITVTTLLSDGPSVYELFAQYNPNSTGSLNYRNILHGHIYIETGWDGSQVVTSVEYNELYRSISSGSYDGTGSLVNVSFVSTTNAAVSTEYITVPNASGSWQMRVRFSNNSVPPGAPVYRAVRLLRKL